MRQIGVRIARKNHQNERVISLTLRAESESRKDMERKEVVRSVRRSRTFAGREVNVSLVHSKLDINSA